MHRHPICEPTSKAGRTGTSAAIHHWKCNEVPIMFCVIIIAIGKNNCNYSNNGKCCDPPLKMQWGAAQTVYCTWTCMHFKKEISIKKTATKCYNYLMFAGQSRRVPDQMPTGTGLGRLGEPRRIASTSIFSPKIWNSPRFRLSCANLIAWRLL